MDKISYGLICCRKRPDAEVEFLMIEKRYTHAFFNFVFGRYHKNDKQQLRTLFNNMTIAEKLSIQTLQFESIWKQLLVNLPHFTQFYKLKKIRENNNYDDAKNFELKQAKFYTTFSYDKYRYLKSLLNNTTNAEPLWEPPKGRSIESESGVQTAIREFKEETNINHTQYTIHDVKPIRQVFYTGKIRHEHHYFIATINDYNFEPKMLFSNFEQSIEVGNIRWISLSKMRLLNNNNIAKNRILNLLACAKNLLKKSQRKLDKFESIC